MSCNFYKINSTEKIREALCNLKSLTFRHNFKNITLLVIIVHKNIRQVMLSIKIFISICRLAQPRQKITYKYCSYHLKV